MIKLCLLTQIHLNHNQTVAKLCFGDELYFVVKALDLHSENRVIIIECLRGIDVDIAKYGCLVQCGFQDPTNACAISIKLIISRLALMKQFWLDAQSLWVPAALQKFQ